MINNHVKIDSVKLTAARLDPRSLYVPLESTVSHIKITPHAGEELEVLIPDGEVSMLKIPAWLKLKRCRKVGIPNIKL